MKSETHCTCKNHEHLNTTSAGSASPMIDVEHTGSMFCFQYHMCGVNIQANPVIKLMVVPTCRSRLGDSGCVFFVCFRNWEKCILRILLRYFISLHKSSLSDYLDEFSKVTNLKQNHFYKGVGSPFRRSPMFTQHVGEPHGTVIFVTFVFQVTPARVRRSPMTLSARQA